MQTQLDCPSREQLKDYLLGRISEDAAGLLGSHLETCPACLETVQTVRCEDTLTSAMRTPSTLIADPQLDLDHLAQRLRLLSLEPGATVGATALADGSSPDAPSSACTDDHSTTQALFDFLSPPEAEGEIGRLGAYRVFKVLGQGGMGVVFEAEDPALKRRVALKVMRPGLAGSGTGARRFLREAQATAAIRHDHIVTIHQVGEHQGAPFLAMELLHGESLDDRLKREGKLPETEVLRIGREVAEGLAAAHEKGLIHRDIKPANIWLEGPRSRVKIVDFGLAHATQQDVHLTQEGALLGTPAYMAPEQAQGQKVDGRADLFSLGCVLYRTCTGKAPFEGTDTISLLMAAATREPTSPRQLCPGISKEFSDFILCLLAKQPGRRPSSADEVADRLRQLEAGAVPGGKQAPTSVGRKWLMGIAAAALILAPAVYYCGGTVLRFATNKGVLVVEIHDPTLKIEVRQNDLVVHDKTVNREFTLTAVDGEVRVFEKDGAEFMTRKFSLRRGGMAQLTVTPEEVKAIAKGGKVVPGKIAPVSGGPFPADAIEEWNAAKWKAPDELVAVLGETRQRTWDAVQNLVFSPDGKYLAAWALGIGTHVWRTQDMQPVAVLKGTGPSCVFLNGGKTLATMQTFEVTFWDVPTFVEKGKLEVHYATNIAASADGSRLAVLNMANELTIWDVNQPKPLQTHALKLKGKVGRGLALTPDGKGVAVADEENLHLWEPDSKKRSLIAIPVTQNKVSFLAFSRDAQILLCQSQTAGRVLKLGQDKPLWETGLGVFGMAVSSDGALLAVGHPNTQAALYSLAGKGERVMTLPAVSRNIRSVAFSADGKILATGGQGGDVRLWDVSKDGITERAPLAGHYDRIQEVCFSADGKWLASVGDHDRLVRVWRWAGAKTEAFAGLRHMQHLWVKGASFSPDGSRILTVLDGGDTKLDHVYFWPMDGKRPPASKDYQSFSKDGLDGTLLPDGKRLALVSPEGLRFWDIPESKVPQPGKLLEGTKGCSSVVTSADGNVLVVGHRLPGGKRFAFAVFRLKEPEGEYASHFKHEISVHDSHRGRFVISADGKHVGVPHGGGVWDISGPAAKLVGFDGLLAGDHVRGLAFSPTSSQFALAGFAPEGGAWVKIFDLQKSIKVPQTIWQMPVRSSGSLAFSRDGQFLVTANGNGTLYVFRVPKAGP